MGEVGYTGDDVSMGHGSYMRDDGCMRDNGCMEDNDCSGDGADM